VLRRIIRRAIRHGHKLGIQGSFFHKLVGPLVEQMGTAYPELAKVQAQVEKVLAQEEERFAETLEQGMNLLEAAIGQLSGKTIPGATVFKLYDTYGFPVDLTADVARERGLTVDQAGFETAMAEQRARARAASGFEMEKAVHASMADLASEFIGYEQRGGEGRVVALYKEGDPVAELLSGEQGIVVLDQTPFYGESGGQVGDTGLLNAGTTTLFEVHDTQKQGNAFLHIGLVREGQRVKVSDSVEAVVDAGLRADIAAHHSATHLLHAALRQVLGDHVQQKGSLCSAERLRFDFSHFEGMTAEELAEVERLVNEQIRLNSPVDTALMKPEDAKNAGAMALFGEKYGDIVRVLSMGDFSTELCGGTHVSRTGDIGLMKIVSEAGVAAGVRRVEAVAASRALSWLDKGESQLTSIGSLLKAGREDTLNKVQSLAERNRKLEKELDALKAKLASSQGSDLASQAVEIGGIKVLAARLEGADPKSLRDTVDQLKNKLGSAAVLLAAVNGDKISITAGVTKDTTDRVKAGDLLKMVAEQVGGKGGGRPDMAQGGGSQPENLDAAIASVAEWVANSLR
jgi:alanyl-tRNA synthetase